MWQTRIHKRTLNPGKAVCMLTYLNLFFNLLFTVFDEDFVFEVRPATIGRRTLEILLYDFDAYSRHVCIGGLKIALAHVDLSDKVELVKSLGPCSEQDAKIELGDIMVSLSFLPSAERLTCVVIKARNLRVFDDTRNSSGTLILTITYELLQHLIFQIHMLRYQLFTTARDSRRRNRVLSATPLIQSLMKLLPLIFRGKHSNIPPLSFWLCMIISLVLMSC